MDNNRDRIALTTTWQQVLQGVGTVQAQGSSFILVVVDSTIPQSDDDAYFIELFPHKVENTEETFNVYARVAHESDSGFVTVWKAV